MLSFYCCLLVPIKQHLDLDDLLTEHVHPTLKTSLRPPSHYVLTLNRSRTSSEPSSHLNPPLPPKNKPLNSFILTVFIFSIILTLVLNWIRAELWMTGYSHATVSFLHFYHMISISTADTVLRLNTARYLRRGKTWSLPRWSLPVSEWSAPGWQLGQREKTEQKKALVWGSSQMNGDTGARLNIKLFCLQPFFRHTLSEWISVMKFPCSLECIISMCKWFRSLDFPQEAV